jgi:phospholipid/cholesterol/gamma-HCH transport system ATP-binding protein
MNVNDPILEFSDATIAAAVREHAGLSHVSARFGPGTLTLIQVEPGNELFPLADLATGLLDPAEGRVLFQGEAWTTMPPEQVLQRRAQIGRVFDGHGWISNLNVNENVTLAQRHHTRRPDAEILAEAEALARAFGLNELPKIRPALVAPQDLQRAEWIRAFLGQPLLVLLERPMQGVPLEHLPRLLGAVQEACTRKAAVLWLTDNDRIGRHPELPPAARYATRGLNLVKMENG